MTIQEIVKRFNKSAGRYLTKKETECTAHLLSFILMDICLQEFDHSIQKIELTHEPAKTRNAWNKYNTTFWTRFEKNFTPDEYIEFTDIMDDCHKALYHDIEICKYAIMKYVDSVHFEYQKQIASVQICNLLSQHAQEIYMMLYRTRRGNPEKNHYIDAVRNYAKVFTNKYYKQLGGKATSLRGHKQLDLAISVLERRIIEWSRNLDESNKAVQEISLNKQAITKIIIPPAKRPLSDYDPNRFRTSRLDLLRYSLLSK